MPFYRQTMLSIPALLSSLIRIKSYYYATENGANMAGHQRHLCTGHAI